MPPETTVRPDAPERNAKSEERDPDALPSFAEMVLGLADLGNDPSGRGSDAGAPPIVAESIRAELPVEMEFRDGTDGKLAIGCSPPTMYTETSWLPAFHSVRLYLAEVEGD